MELSIDEINHKILSNSDYKEIKRYYEKYYAALPYEKLFSRSCSISENPCAHDPDDFRDHFVKIYQKPPPFEILPNEEYDPMDYYNSTNVTYKVLQTGYRLGIDFKTPKYNKFKYCPLCQLDFKKVELKKKAYKFVEAVTPGGIEVINCKIPGFYLTGNSEYNKHLGNTHGVLKGGSIIPQPFVGFSKSESNLNEWSDNYKLSIVCPFQHQDPKTNTSRGCNAIFLFNQSQKTTTPYKAYFRHFYKSHLNDQANKVTILKNIPRHISSEYNVFFPICADSYNETIQYQKSNNPTSWSSAILTPSINIIKHFESFLVSPGTYTPPNTKQKTNLAYENQSRIKRSPGMATKKKTRRLKLSSIEPKSLRKPTQKSKNPLTKLDKSFFDIVNPADEVKYDGMFNGFNNPYTNGEEEQLDPALFESTIQDYVISEELGKPGEKVFFESHEPPEAVTPRDFDHNNDSITMVPLNGLDDDKFKNSISISPEELSWNDFFKLNGYEF